MGFSSEQKRTFNEVFENYPWNSLPLALERGALELIDANEMEEGEIYIIARKDNFGSGKRSLKITTEVLRYQLFSILSQDDSINGIKTILNNRLWMYKDYKNQIVTDEIKKIMEKYGLDYKPSIDLSDTFIMACYYSKLQQEGTQFVKIGYNNVKRFLEVVFSNRDFSFINKGATRVLTQKREKETESERLRSIVRNDSYNTSSNEINQWAYVFKIQLQNFKDSFMNWDIMPF